MNITRIKAFEGQIKIEFEEEKLTIVAEKDDFYLVKFTDLKIKKIFEFPKKQLSGIRIASNFGGTNHFYILEVFENQKEEAKQILKETIIKDLELEINSLQNRLKNYKEQN